MGGGAEQGDVHTNKIVLEIKTLILVYVIQSEMEACNSKLLAFDLLG